MSSCWLKIGYFKNRLMYSQRSFSLFGDYPSRPADQSQGFVQYNILVCKLEKMFRYGSMISNSVKDQSSESPNMYSRYLERARSVRDRKEKGMVSSFVRFNQ